jgi:hypothetical protein
MAVLSNVSAPQKEVIFSVTDPATGGTRSANSPIATQRDEDLYAVQGIPRQVIQDKLFLGLARDLEKAAAFNVQEKDREVYNNVISQTTLDDTEGAILELESLREDNEFFKRHISPATVAALRNTDNPEARRFAQNNVANVFLAAETLRKVSEEQQGFWNITGDFLDAAITSNVPILSAYHYKQREELAKNFAVLLESTLPPERVQPMMEKLLRDAGDQGLLTQSNLFYISDFIGLASSGTKSEEAALQKAFASLDTVFWAAGAAGSIAKRIPGAFAGASVLRRAAGKEAQLGAKIGMSTDTARLAAATTENPSIVEEILTEAVKIDNPKTAATQVVNHEASLVTPSMNRMETVVSSVASARKTFDVKLKSWFDVMNVMKWSGKSLDKDKLEGLYKTVTEERLRIMNAGGAKRLIDIEYGVDELENITALETYGTKAGTGFNRKSEAQKLADKLGGAIVAPENGNPKRFVVLKPRNIPQPEFLEGAKTRSEYLASTEVYGNLSVKELGRSAITRWLGSPLSQTTEKNATLLWQGEQARSRGLGELTKSMNKSIKAAGKEGVLKVNAVVSSLNKGTLAAQRTWMTAEQFDAEFFSMHKRLPTQAEKDLHSKMHDFNDTQWALAADFYLKQAVNKGYEVIEVNNIEYVAKVHKPGDTVRVFDAEKVKYVQVKDLEEGKVVYRLGEPSNFRGQASQYVATDSPKTRMLFRQDVMEYNAGGPRMYTEEFEAYVKQSNEVADPHNANTTLHLRPTTIMAAKTSQEAQKGAAAINRIITKINEIVSTDLFASGEAYLEHLKTIGLKKALDDFIAEGSEWNDSIRSIDDFLKFAEDYGLDLRKPVTVAQKDTPLIGDPLSDISDITYADTMRSPGRLHRGFSRRDEVLHGYGWNEMETYSPVEAIQKSLMSSVSRHSQRPYLTTAVNTLVRAALEVDTPPASRIGLVSDQNLAEIRNLTHRQKLNNLVIQGNSPEAQKLRLEQDRIKARLSQTNFLDDAFNHWQMNLSRALYDKDHKKLAAVAANKYSKNVVSAMKGITFDTFFWLAPDQLWVQGSAILNVVTLSKGLSGVKALATFPIVRGLVLNGNPEVIKAGSKVLAKSLSITEKQAEDIVYSYMQNGRNFVASSIADLGEDSAGNVYLRKAREGGRLFFYEGERIGRIGAHIAASLEYIQENGLEAADLMTEVAKRRVTYRSHMFTMAMSSDSRTSLEKLPMTQFLSYAFRVTEYLTSGLFSGKGVLTASEKAKFMSAQLLLWGGAFVPAGNHLLDRYFFNDSEGDSVGRNLIQNGAIDAMMELLTGVETEVGRRLAWGEGIWKLGEDFATNSVFEIAAGPSFSVGEKTITSFARMLKNIAKGNSNMALSEGVAMLRTIKSVNMAYNTYMAYRFSEYWTRSGLLVASDVTSREAIFIALGVPLEKINQPWRDADIKSETSDYYREQGKLATSYINQLNDELEKFGNTSKAEELREAFVLLMNVHTAEERMRIYSFLDPSVKSLHEQLTIDLMRIPN